MDVSRREFLRAMGIAVASIAGARQLAGCGSSAPPTATVMGPESGLGGPLWTRLRACWTGLTEWELAVANASRRRFAGQPLDSPVGQVPLVPEEREAEHRAALDALVAAGELRAPVAERLQGAFEEVSFELQWRWSSGATCYEPSRLGSELMDSRGRILARLNTLDELVAGGTVGPDVVAASRAALEHDLAVLDAGRALDGLEGDEWREAEDRLVETIEDGGPEPDADEREAAHVLVRLVLASP